MASLMNDVTIITVSCCYSDRRSGTLSLICELMDMNIYELIKGTLLNEAYLIGSTDRTDQKRAMYAGSGSLVSRAYFWVRV